METINITRSRLLTAVLCLAFLLSSACPASALRPMPDRAGLEESLQPAAGLEEGAGEVLNAVDARGWTQFRQFSAQLQRQGLSWDDAVTIAAFWADVDWTLCRPDRFENQVYPSIAESIAWILGSGGSGGIISGSPYRGHDFMDPGLYFPASVDRRIVDVIRTHLRGPSDLSRFSVLSRSGGTRVKFLRGEEAVQEAPVSYADTDKVKISRAFVVAFLNALSRKEGLDLAAQIKAAEEAPNLWEIAKLIRRAQEERGLVRLPGMTPLEVDPTMIFLSFQDNAFAPAEVSAMLQEARGAIGDATGKGLPIDFIQGPMYIAASLLKKEDELAKQLEREPPGKGLLIVAGDGSRDDLPMLVRAGLAPGLLVYPLYVGRQEGVAADLPVITPHGVDFADATGEVLGSLVQAAREGKPYAELPLFRGRFSLRQLGAALGFAGQSPEVWLPELLSWEFADFERARTTRLAAGLEETDFLPPQRITTPRAEPIWVDEKGGDVIPSGRERLARMAFQSPRGGPRQYLRIFGSLNVGDLPPELSETHEGRPLLEYLPQEGVERGYLDSEKIPDPYVRKKIKAILADPAKAPQVRARVRLSRVDVGIPMRAINVWKGEGKAGRIRFEGRVPAEDERFLLVDRPFTVEIFWQGRWHRLHDEGRVRIERPNPAQIAAQPDADDTRIGVRDAQDELRFARGLLAEEKDDSLRKQKEEQLDQGVVTDETLPWKYRSTYLSGLVSEKGITPAQARTAFLGQQIEAEVQKRGYFEGTQHKLLGSRWETLIMYNPNRDNAPKPIATDAYPLSDAKPKQFRHGDGSVETLKQRAKPEPSDRLKSNPVKVEANPYGYVYMHATVPVTRQIPQEEWSEALVHVVEEMWRQAERLSVAAVNFGSKGGASLDKWAHAHDIPWRAPIDEVGDGEIRWVAIRNGIRVGLLRDPFTTTFVFEGGGSSQEQDRMIEEANGLWARLREQGLGQLNAWGAVRADGVGRLYVTPRNPAEPEPPSDPAQKEKWKPTDDYAKPLADQDFWFVELSPGQYRLMGQAEMQRCGLRPMERDPSTGRPMGPGPHVPKGRPVLEIKFGIMEMRHHLLVSKMAIYEDPFLEARLARSYDLVGLPWQDARIHTLIAQLKQEEYSDADSEKEVREVLAAPEGIRTAEQLMDLVERIATWRTRHVQAFHRLPGPRRDEFNWKIEDLIERFSGERPDLVRETAGPRPSVVPVGAVAKLRPLEAVSVGPALDRGMRLVDEEGTRYLQVWRSAGTSPANIAQASALLGRPSREHALLEGRTGGKTAAALGEYGVQVELLPPGEEPARIPTRVTLLIASSRPGRRERRLVGEGGPLSEGFVAQLPSALETQLAGAAAPFTLVVGERLVGPHALQAARAIAGRARAVREGGNRACVAANRSWDPQIWETFLAAQPNVMSVPLDVFSEFLDAREGAVEYREDLLRSRPEQIAEAADRYRRQHGVQEWLVSMGGAGVVLVTDRGWWHGVSSPVLELTYLNGAADVADAAYLLMRAEDASPLDSLIYGITASTLFMEQDGLVPTGAEVETHLFRAQLNVLPRPLATAGLEEGKGAAAEQPARERWEVEVDEAAQLPHGRIFRHQGVPVPDFWKRAAWGVYNLPDEVVDADRRLSVTLSEKPVSPADVALVSPDVVGADVAVWDGLLREHRLAGVQVTPAVLAKLSDPALAAVFLKQIQKVLAATGGLVMVTDIDVRTDTQGARRLIISA